MSVSAAVMLLVEMIFQIDHFKRDDWSANCTINGSRFLLNGSDWLGVRKVDGSHTMIDLLSGYICEFFNLFILIRKYLKTSV